MDDSSITLITLVVLIALFVWNRLPVELVAIGTSLALYGLGILTLHESLAGFSHPATVLIASLFVVSEALDSMGPNYRAELDSDVADLTNLGGMNAGASSAAEFLAHFTKGVPWAHIDIAGVAATPSPKGWKSRGMSGFGARLLVDVLEQFGRK